MLGAPTFLKEFRKSALLADLVGELD